MAPYGFSITMGVNWRGQLEEFSNVYHYDLVSAPSESLAQSIVTAIKEATAPQFGAQVSFLRARVYGPTDGTKAENVMRHVFDMTGGGAQVSGGEVPYELTAVVQAYVGRGPAGGKQFMRKYFHFCRHQNLGAGSAASLGNAALGQSTRDAFSGIMTALKNLQPAGNNIPICTPKGKHLPNGAVFETLPHLHTRQFRR